MTEPVSAAERATQSLADLDARTILPSWLDLCTQEGALSGGGPLAVDLEVVRMFLDELEVAANPREELEAPSARILLNFLTSTKSAGTAMRQILCLSAVLADALGGRDADVRVELLRRLLTLSNRCIVTVGSAALVSVNAESLLDVLTGVPNRRAFERAFASAVASRQPFTLVNVDLDDLKKINDGAGGHKQGDAAIRGVGQAVRAQLPPSGGDIYRVGGDEFLVLLPGEKFAYEAVEAVITKARVSAPAFSCGIARWPDDEPDPDKVKEVADARMYEDKVERKRLATSRRAGPLPEN